jgi:hypothetical protein
MKCAEYLLESKIYQMGTVMKNIIWMGASKPGDGKGFKMGEWDEIIKEDENLCIVKWKGDMCYFTVILHCK